MKKILFILSFSLSLLNFPYCFAGWQPLPLNGLYSFPVNCIVTNGNNIFVGAGSWDGEDCGVFLSTDNGLNWVPVDNGLSNKYINSLAIIGENILTSTGDSVYISTDNGSKWTTIKNGTLTNIGFKSIAITGVNIFAGTYEGVYLSTDNGVIWTAVNNGLTDTNIVSSLVINGNNIFAGTEWGGGVFLSSDNGANWTSMNNGLTNKDIHSLVVSEGNIFAGTWGGGIFLSNDNSKNWTAVNNGLTDTRINALIISGTNIFAGTEAKGVFLSSNNGENWDTINYGLKDIFIQSLAISGGYIYAGTDAGLWRRPLSEVIGVVNELTVQSSMFKVKCFPNPANQQTTISYQLPAKSKVMIKVYDIMGNEVETLINETQEAGDFKINFNAEYLSRGVYFVKLTSDNGVRVGKLIKN